MSKNEGNVNQFWTAFSIVLSEDGSDEEHAKKAASVATLRYWSIKTEISGHFQRNPQ